MVTQRFTLRPKNSMSILPTLGYALAHDCAAGAMSTLSGLAPVTTKANELLKL